MYLFLSAFRHHLIIVVISLHIRVILNNISGVNYHVGIQFPICHVYSQVIRKQILLNSLNYTSLGSFFHLKKEAAFDRHEVTIFPKENVVIFSF